MLKNVLYEVKGRIKKIVLILLNINKYDNKVAMILAGVMNKIPKVISINGLKFRNADISIVHEIIIDKVYNKYHNINKNDIVVDIGANTGIFSIFAAQNGAIVYAYEPDHENCANIKINAKENKLVQRIHLYETAIADKKKYIKLYMVNSWGHTLFSKHKTGELKNFKLVNCQTLNSIMKKLGKVDFMKMDCEGSEGLIFMATSKRSWKNIHKIVLEYHDANSPLKHKEIISILTDNGFTVKHTKKKCIIHAINRFYTPN